MDKHKINTIDELCADRKELEQNMDALITKRTKLQNKIRRANPEEKEVLRIEKAETTAQIYSA